MKEIVLICIKRDIIALRRVSILFVVCSLGVDTGHSGKAGGSLFLLYGVSYYLAFSCHKESGKATRAQTLELLPQGLDDLGLALLWLAPQVLLQTLLLQRAQGVA